MPLSDLERVCIREPTSSARCGVGISRSKRDLPPADYLFKIQSFPLAVEKKVKKYESNVFRAGGYSWKLVLYPNGKSKRNGKGHVSLYLTIADTEKLSRGWEVNVNFKLFVFDHNCNNYLTIQDADGVVRKFNEMKSEWGFEQLITLEELFDSCNGYLDEEDTCVFGAEVFVIRHSGNWESFDVAGDKPPTTNGSSNDGGKPPISGSDGKPPTTGSSTDGGKPPITGSDGKPPTTGSSTDGGKPPISDSDGKPPTTGSSTDGKPPTSGSITDNKNPTYGSFTAKFDSFYMQQTTQYLGFRACKRLWSVRVTPSGDGSNARINVDMSLIDRDKYPSNPIVDGSVKFKILDQLHNKYHYERTENFSFLKMTYCVCHFISVSELNQAEKGYIKDDAVIFEIEIFMKSIV